MLDGVQRCGGAVGGAGATEFTARTRKRALATAVTSILSFITWQSTQCHVWWVKQCWPLGQASRDVAEAGLATESRTRKRPLATIVTITSIISSICRRTRPHVS